MRHQILIGSLLASAAWAQPQDPGGPELVAAMLRAHDPLHDGRGAEQLLGLGVSLDEAIVATARSTTTERVVRLRAERLARALDLAHRVRAGQQRRDAAWWLAFAEIAREVPGAVRPLLLVRTRMDAAAVAAASTELAAADAVVQRFCREWSEVRHVGDAYREENAKYDELEAALAAAGSAAVPALLDTLVVPPEIAFGQQPAQGITARHQVKAILALAVILELDAALPFFVMHTQGPSLTQSTHAAMAVQRFRGEHPGATFLVDGDEAALLAWWQEHRSGHRVVLDYLVRHVVQWAEHDLQRRDARRTEGARCALMRIERALGKAAAMPADADVEVLRARLADVASEWALPRAR